MWLITFRSQCSHWYAGLGRLCNQVFSLITPSALLIEQSSRSISMVCRKYLAEICINKPAGYPQLAVYIQLQLGTSLPAQSAKQIVLWVGLDELWKEVTRHECKRKWATFKIQDLVGRHLTSSWLKFLVFCAAFFNEQGGCRKKLGSDLTVSVSSHHRT